ncbi:hypothetical protein AGMMS49992_03440 [Clostridia bacterium]|nr:hypothetical protein AGMMS49992_03440 [Clostridia bacterium]
MGPMGPAGPMGPMGPAGPVGPQGPGGSAGPEGPVGPQGPIGPEGPTGADGAQGPMGPEGPMGPIGPMGPSGMDGIDGAPGQQGPIGATGPRGPQGDIGPAGDCGPTGCVRTAFFVGGLNIALPLTHSAVTSSVGGVIPVPLVQTNASDNISIGPQGKFIEITDPGYYLINWFGQKSNVSAAGAAELTLKISNCNDTGFDRKETVVSFDDNADFAYWLLTYLDEGCVLEFLLTDNGISATYSLDRFDVDISQINSFSWNA